MFPNVKGSEQVAILGQISPSSQAAGSLTTGWLSAAQFQKFLAIIQVGAFGASATVDANIQQATSSGGAGAKAITTPTGAPAITELAAAGGNNVQCEINLDAQFLDVNNGFDYIQLTITVGVAATETSGVLLGFVPRLAPASDWNATSVTQIVN
jgi:hypothetical protein